MGNALQQAAALSGDENSCEVTAELWALYLIMRQLNIDLQWLTAAFSGIALFLEQPGGGLSNHNNI